LKHPKSAKESDKRTDRLTARVFFRAACLATLVTVPSCALCLLVTAAVLRDGAALLVGFVLILFITVAIWITAAVMGTMLLVPLRLWDKRHYPVVRSQRWLGPRSSVWDEWLDGPRQA
jgi:hypothetical protein